MALTGQPWMHRVQSMHFPLNTTPPPARFSIFFCGHESTQRPQLMHSSWNEVNFLPMLLAIRENSSAIRSRDNTLPALCRAGTSLALPAPASTTPASVAATLRERSGSSEVAHPGVWDGSVQNNNSWASGIQAGPVPGNPF
jgi:hypothetical protein